MPSTVPCVLPAEVIDVDVTAVVEHINALLSMPWRPADLSQGRVVPIAPLDLAPAAVQEVLALYRAATWRVNWDRAEDTLTFRPPAS